MKLYQKIEAVAAARGKEKLALLKTWQEDKVLVAYLRATYEPTISYFLTPVVSAPTGTGVNAEAEEQVKTILAFAKTVRTVRGGAAKTLYAATAAGLDGNHRRLLDLMLYRDVKAGISTSTINKCWAGLITDVPYMRCSTPAMAKVNRWPWGTPGFYAFSQIKADGMYANICPGGCEGMKIISRQGSVFPEGPWSTAILKALGEADKIHNQLHVYNGELVVYENGVALPRHIGNGKMNHLLNEGEWEGTENMEVRYLVWDLVPLQSFTPAATQSRPYYLRLALLNSTLHGPSPVSVIETKKVTTYEEAARHFIEKVKEGEEGTVLKKFDAAWRDGNSIEQVKMKIEFEVDLRITALNPGDPNGKHAKTFGSLRCESSDGRLVVGVSGINDDLRGKIAANPQAYVGKIAAVTGNDILTCRAEAASIYLPRLVIIREDKTEADSIERCREALAAALEGQEMVKRG